MSQPRLDRTVSSSSSSDSDVEYSARNLDVGQLQAKLPSGDTRALDIGVCSGNSGVCDLSCNPVSTLDVGIERVNQHNFAHIVAEDQGPILPKSAVVNAESIPCSSKAIMEADASVSSESAHLLTAEHKNLNMDSMGSTLLLHGLPLTQPEHPRGCVPPSIISEELTLHDVHPREATDSEDDQDDDSIVFLGDELSTAAPEFSEDGSSDETEIDIGVIPDMVDDGLLYANAPLSTEESLISILSFAQAENLSGVGTANLFKLVELHCPQPNNCFKSLSGVFNFFKKIKTPLESHFNCSKCLKVRDSLTDICFDCQSVNPSVDQIIVVPLVDQLTQLYERPGFLNDIMYKQQRVKSHPNNIEDLYDGLVYKEAEQGILSNPLNVSLMWHGDGVVPFESLNLDIWLFYFAINELPPDKRFKRENLLLAAVYVGRSKPETNVLLKYVYPHTEVLKSGFKVSPPGFEEPIEVKAVILCGSCDSPAKALFFHQKSYSGYYSCPKCLCRGEKSDRTEQVTVFPYEEIIPRTEEEYEQDAHLAAVSNAGVPEKHRVAPHGIKGTTYLYLMVESMFRSTSIDTMHELYLGVTKQMLRLWFKKKYQDEDFSLYKVLNVVNQRLMSICPPAFVKRMPSQLNTPNVKLKAYEYMILLFYTLLPCLEGVMKQVYFHNFKLLVAGASLLNFESIPTQDIGESNGLLRQFVKDFEELYGLRHMSFNLHLLVHLPKVTEELGPSWCTSCFRFEDMNGKICNLIHGSRFAGSQIASNLSLFTTLPQLVINMSPGRAKEFCTTVVQKGKRVRLLELMFEKSFSVGKYVRVLPLPQWMSDALHDHPVENVFTFERIKIRSVLVTSERYLKCTKTCSNYVHYSVDGSHRYGLVKTFAKLTECLCTEHCMCSGEFIAFVQEFKSQMAFQTSNPPFSIRHIQKCDVTQSIVAVPIKSFVNVCFYVNVDGIVYLADPLNAMEMYN